MRLTRVMARGVALRLVLSALAAGGLAACSDVTNLDESAETFISPDKFYQNDGQAQIAVHGAYAPLMGWNGWIQPAQHSIMCDDNEMLCWNWMGGGFSGNISGQWYAQDNATWFGDYQMIERANEVIKYVNEASGVTEAMKKQATGQALFIRAYAYFDLVRRYGGVPVRLEPYVPDEQMGALGRAPADSVWRVIARDLRQAAGLLPTSYSQANGQALPRKASAWGLLAKVYLHMAGDEVTGTPLTAAKSAYLDSARVAAQAAINDPSVGLEARYADLFDVNKQNTSPEILFAVQGARTNLRGSNVTTFYGPRGDCTAVGGCGTGFMSVREDFYRTFDPSDKRIEPNVMIARSWEVSQSPLGKIRALHVDSIAKLEAAGLVVRAVQFRWESWTEGCGAFGHWYDTLEVRPSPTATNFTRQIVAVGRPIYSNKFIDPSAAGGSEYANANNFPILRLADVLLVFAEAENERNGPSAAAYDALNRVRTRAGLPALTGLNQATFRQAVWDERSHELYGEFQARFDLLRQGRYLTEMNKPSTIPDYAGHGVCRPRQAYQKLHPIPQREISANPMLQQNQGY
ncbi:MAG TPA: RagB/SusD family nutrient uptake outer membrane protein [Gemmatimonadaceae bacterium]|nr:RagB/SusD family nutrient uptake outer membrane protein [Gemmatimonadaceae bacterium]